MSMKLEEMEKGAIYRLCSRNLRLGVFDGTKGFMGIRKKFGCEYLFTEYHWDTGAPYGTATPIEKLGVVPEGIEIKEYLGRTADERIPNDQLFALLKTLEDKYLPVWRAEEEAETQKFIAEMKAKKKNSEVNENGKNSSKQN